MNRKLGGLCAALSSMGLLLAGCEQPKSTLEKTLEAMGGAALQEAGGERVVGTFARFEPGESSAPGKNSPKVAEVTHERLLDLRARRMRTRYQISTDLLFPAQLDYREVITGKLGYVEGLDSILGGPPRAAMAGGRLAAREREAWLTSPARLLSLAQRTPQRVTEEASVTREGKTYEAFSVLAEPGVLFKVLVDPQSHRVARVETLEDHPPLGDVLVSAVFEDYRQVSGISVPGRVTVYADEHKVHEEARSELTVPATVATSEFEIPEDLQAEASESELRLGSRLGQWATSFGYLGLPFLFVDQSAAPVLLTEVGPGVQLISGASHNSLVVEMSDHLVLVDAPLSEARMLAVLEKLDESYPSKPVRHLVNTHFHYDHSAGMRAVAAEGNVTVYAQAVSAAFVEQVMQRPHTLVPDRLSMQKVPVTVRSVDTLETLTDSQGRKVEIHKVSSTHSEDMTVVYVPDAKVLFEADLFNPNPETNGQPASGRFQAYAAELYDEVRRLNLDVAAVTGGHGVGAATLEHLRLAAGR